MNEMKLNWEDLNLFLAVARAEGLAGAVKTTGKSAPTLGRKMLTLEAVTGTELFRRLSRGYELTEQGTALFNKVVKLEAQILPLDRSLEAENRTLVKFSAGSWMTYALCQKTKHILKDNVRTRLRFISAEQVLDIAHRETIIGIRNQRPEQNFLACRKLGNVKFAGYALDGNVENWIRVVSKTPSALWLAAQPDVTFSVEATSPRNALDLALNGIAKVLLPTFIGDREKALTRVTDHIPELTHNQWLVTHQDERFQS